MSPKITRKVTFDGDPPPGTINLGIGQPSPDLLPVSLLRESADTFLAEARPQDLNYGDRQGDTRFRRSLAEFLSPEYGVPVNPESLFVTAGNSQALDFVCSVFTHPGDTVVCEEPSYFLAFRIFEDHGLNVVPVATDADGMDIAELEAVLTRTKPALVYTIPSYHNPGGQSLSAARRRRLVALSREHGFVIAADEVYQLLWYGQPPPPALGTMIADGNVVSLGSFSKILAPGLRLGWIQASPALLERILESGVVNSGGSFNHFTSLVARRVIDSGRQLAFVRHLRAAYARRVEVMDAELSAHFDGRARWLRPGGGYFFWLECAAGVDTAALRARSDRFEVGFQPGVNFSSRGALANFLRLSFAHYPEDDIREGIARLARLFQDEKL
jgi:DNA-binding transcriptional MocR family regulator